MCLFGDRSRSLTLTSLIISTLVGRAEEEEEEEEAGEILKKSLTAGEEGAGRQVDMLTFFADSTREIEAQHAAKQEQGLIEGRMWVPPSPREERQ